MEKKKRISKKQLNEFLTKNFNVVKTTEVELEDAPDSYVSKIDGSYLTFVGLEEDIKYLLRKGITEQLQNTENVSDHTVNIGFNPIEQKWYGWSHRAIYGFGVGSKCEKGHCHYQPDTKETFKEDCLRFWGDTDMNETHKTNPIAEEGTQDGKLGIWVRYSYDDKVPNKKMRGQISGVFSEYPEKWGKGEWTAKTLDDAKQMAIDFANGVS